MTTERPTAEQIVSWTQSLSNWGRWGADDARGTLNLITPEARLRGLAAAITGDCVPCGREIDVSNPAMLPVARRYMLATGESATGTPRPGGAADELHFRPHSLDLTHLDALSHASWDGRMYN